MLAVAAIVGFLILIPLACVLGKLSSEQLA
jgi:hypothetical protein